MENPDPLCEFGLGCKACQWKFGCDQNIFCSFSYGGSGKTLLLEDLLRHGNHSKRQRAGKIPKTKLHAQAVLSLQEAASASTGADLLPERRDVPSVAQFRIAYNLCKNAGACSSLQYERDCETARMAGDKDNVPSTRCCRVTMPKIGFCIAEAMFRSDRDELMSKASPVVMTSFKSDVRKKVDLVKMRSVNNNFECVTKLFDVHSIDGSKTSFDKAHQFKEALAAFASGSEDVQNVIRRTARSMTADGEPAEQLSLRFIKELDILPEVTVFMRCSLHATTRFLENALRSDTYCLEVLQTFVLKFAGLQNGQHGSFARAIRNSEKLKYEFGEAVTNGLTELAKELQDLGAIAFKATRRGGDINMSNALSRFSSWLHILVKVCYWGRAIMWFLWDTSLHGSVSSAWAREILDFMLRPSEKRGMANCLLLAMIAEFTAAVRKAITKFDHNKKNTSVNNVATTARKLADMESELKHLFDVEHNGEPRLPWCLDAKYTFGFVAIMRQSLRWAHTTIVLHDSKVISFSAAQSNTSLQSLAAEELASILNVKHVFLRLVHAEYDASVGMAFRSFDPSQWTDVPEHRLAESLEPVARAVHVDLSRLVEQLHQARPLVQRLHEAHPARGLGELWREAMQDCCGRRKQFAKQWHELAQVVYLMLSISDETGEVEQDFSQVEQFAGGNQSSTNVSTLRSYLKIRLDGPATNEFVRMQEGKHFLERSKYIPSALCLQAQKIYHETYGARALPNRLHARPRMDKGRSRNQKRGLVGVLRAREEQLDHSKSKHGGAQQDDTSDLSALVAETTKAAQKKRWGAQQEEHMKRADTAHAKQKVRLQLESAGIGAHGKIVKKIKHDKDKAQAKAEAKASLCVRNFAHQVAERRLLPCAEVAVWVCDDVTKRMLVQAGLLEVNVVKSLWSLLDAPCASKAIFWVDGLSDALETKVCACNAVKRRALLGARCFGTFLVDPEWIESSKKFIAEENSVLEPLLRFERALDTRLEIWLSNHFSKEYVEIHEFLDRAAIHASSRWVRRYERFDIRDPKNAVALMSSEQQSKNQEKQSHIQTELKAAREARDKEKLETYKKKELSNRGTPMTLDMFVASVTKCC